MDPFAQHVFRSGPGRLLAILALAFLWAGFCPANGAGPFTYNTGCTLEGKLVTATADPSDTWDEKPHDFPALALGAPISVERDPNDEFGDPESGVQTIQLVLSAPLMKEFKSLKGRAVSIRGKLFHAQTGHHFTPVLLEVESIAAR